MERNGSRTFASSRATVTDAAPDNRGTARSESPGVVKVIASMKHRT
jgi:hypothetical protein